jgi:hypothetical protein
VAQMFLAKVIAAHLIPVVAPGCPPCAP